MKRNLGIGLATLVTLGLVGPAMAGGGSTTGPWLYTEQAAWPQVTVGSGTNACGGTWESPLSFVDNPYPLAPQSEPTSLSLGTAVLFTAGTSYPDGSHDTTLEFSIDPSVKANQKQITVGTNAAYTLVGFHMHVPAEHLLPNPGDFELHMKATNGAITAVFAVEFQNSRTAASNPFVTALTSAISNKKAPTLDLTSIFDGFESSPVYSYYGGLTTPPCTSGIQFYVLQQPIVVNISDYTGLVQALTAKGYGPNARYVQSWDALRVAIVNP